jgi:hypothetical protein
LLFFESKEGSSGIPSASRLVASKMIVGVRKAVPVLVCASTSAADRENAQSFAGFFSEVVKTYLGGQQRSEAGSAVQTSERNALIAGQVDIETVRAGGKFIDEILERNAKEAQDAERKGPESTDPEGFLRELIEEGTKEKPSPEEAKKPRTDIVR